MSLFSFHGKRPDNLGVTDLKLGSCPNTPNCVSTQDEDEQHKIEPLAFNSSPSDAIAKLASVIKAMEGSEIIVQSNDYIHAEFTSKIMGFRDDVEFYIGPQTQVIQVRAAARLGKSDLGVNRKRIEAIRKGFNDAA